MKSEGGGNTLFSLVNTHDLNKIVVYTCNSTEEYRDFVRDIDSIESIASHRAVLRGDRDFSNSVVPKNLHLDQHDGYVLVFMNVGSLCIGTEILGLVSFRDYTLVRRFHPQFPIVDCTDYISCVYSRRTGATWTRDDTAKSGKGKLSVKS